MKKTNLALLSLLAGFAMVVLTAVPTTDAAAVYVVYPAADADDKDGLATLNQTPNDDIEVGGDITVLRKGGGGGVVGGVGGGRSSKRCKSGKTRETLACKGGVTGKVRLIEGLNCPDLGGEDTAITVKEGATLDCQGNTIIGSGYGIGIEVEEGGIVRNCKIVGFGYGIYSTGPSTITNCVISDVLYSALDYDSNTSSPKDKYEAKNIYITGAEFGIYIAPNGKTNRFKFDSVTIANPAISPSPVGIYVYGNMAGSSLTFNKITSAADALFDDVEGSGTIKINSSIFDGGGVSYTEKSGPTNAIKLSIEKTLIINAPRKEMEEKIWAESIINLILPLPPPWTYPIRPLCSVAEMVFTLILALRRWTQSSSVAIPEEALLQEIPT